MDDLKQEAKIQGLKISHSMVDEFQSDEVNSKQQKADTPPKSSKGRKLSKTADQALVSTKAPEPRMKRKKRKSTEDLARDSRKLKTLENYNSLSYLFEDSASVGKKGPAPTDNLDNLDNMGEPNESEVGPSTPALIPSQDDFSVAEVITGDTNKLVENHQNQDIIEKHKSPFTRLRGNSNSRNKGGNAATSKDDSSTSNTNNSSDDYDSDGSKTDVVKDLYYNKIKKMEDELKSAKGQIISLQEQVISKEKIIETQQLSINELREECQQYSKVNLKLSEKLVNFLSKGNAKKTEFREETVNVKKSLSFDSPQKIESDSDSLGVNSFGTPPKKVKIDPDASTSPNKQLKKVGSPKIQKSQTKKTQGEGDVVLNDELYKMVLLALKGKTPLQSDGDGKVHLGNGIWISEKAWSEELRKASVSPSIAVRDAMTKLYKPAELAERSLEGGTPVKAGPSGIKIKKKKMTPAKREALLGLYRAKTAAASGSEDKCFLDLAVSKKGRDTIKYKFKQAAAAAKPKTSSPS